MYWMFSYIWKSDTIWYDMRWQMNTNTLIEGCVPKYSNEGTNKYGENIKIRGRLSWIGLWVLNIWLDSRQWTRVWPWWSWSCPIFYNGAAHLCWCRLTAVCRIHCVHESKPCFLSPHKYIRVLCSYLNIYFLNLFQPCGRLFGPVCWLVCTHRSPNTI